MFLFVLHSFLFLFSTEFSVQLIAKEKHDYQNQYCKTKRVIAGQVINAMEKDWNGKTFQ